MSILQRLLILAIVPLAAWNGMPHVACRCSNGEIRLFCSQMNQQAKPRKAGATECISNSSERKSCCHGGEGTCCSVPPADSSERKTECCAAGCQCTPICIQTDTSTLHKKIDLPDVIDFNLAVTPSIEVQLPRLPRVNCDSMGIDDRVPDDLIVLCERWLI